MLCLCVTTVDWRVKIKGLCHTILVLFETTNPAWHKAEYEAEVTRPRSQKWPQGHTVLEDLTFLLCTNCMHKHDNVMWAYYTKTCILKSLKTFKIWREPQLLGPATHSLLSNVKLLRCDVRSCPRLPRCCMGSSLRCYNVQAVKSAAFYARRPRRALGLVCRRSNCGRTLRLTPPSTECLSSFVSLSIGHLSIALPADASCSRMI